MQENNMNIRNTTKYRILEKLSMLDRFLTMYCTNFMVQQTLFKQYAKFMVEQQDYCITYPKQALIAILYKSDDNLLLLSDECATMIGDLCQRNNYKCHENCLMQYSDVCNLYIKIYYFFKLFYLGFCMEIFKWKI